MPGPIIFLCVVALIGVVSGLILIARRALQDTPDEQPDGDRPQLPDGLRAFPTEHRTAD